MRGVSDLITSLPAFLGPFFFFGDELHMLGHGIDHLVFNLLEKPTRNKFMPANMSSYAFDTIEGFTLRTFGDKLGQ